MRKKIASLLLGIFLVIIGILYLFDATGVVNIDLYKILVGWWTLFIIIPAIYSMITNKINAGNSIALVVGLIFLADEHNLFAKDTNIWSVIVATIIIILGINLIFTSIFRFKIKNEIKNSSYNMNTGAGSIYTTQNDYLNKIAVFCGEELSVNSANFTGAKLSAIFGGLDINVSGSAINGDIIIYTTAVFGGIDLKLPPDVNVRTSRTSIFGGTDVERTEGSVIPNRPTVYIYTTAIFGGIDIL